LLKRTGGPICWNWTWTLQDGGTGGTTVTMSTVKDPKLDKFPIKGDHYGLSGTWEMTAGDWNTDGAVITVDWRRGAGKEDKLILSEKGQSLTGTNFQTTENGIVAQRKPCAQ
jgi:hypothetical protein